MIGWNREHRFDSDELVEQFAAALDNVLEVVRAAGGAPWNIASMTVYVTDMAAYRAGVAANLLEVFLTGAPDNRP